MQQRNYSEDSHNEVSKVLRKEAEAAKAEALNAERRFHDRRRAIEFKASHHSIDLFGGNAAKEVMEIGVETQKACEDLYTTCQALIHSLDDQCRPLLQSEPDSAAVKAVLDTIHYLNEHSEVGSEYSASVNNISFGNVANTKYTPSLACQTIEKYWDAAYKRLHEKNADLEAALARQAEAEKYGVAVDDLDRHKAYLAAKQELNDARTVKELRLAMKTFEPLGGYLDSAELVKKCKNDINTLEEKEKAAAGREAEEERVYAAWEEEVKRINQEREKKAEELCAKEIARKQKEVQQRQGEAEQSTDREIQARSAEKQDAEKTLAGLGLFKFSDKKALREKIERLSGEVEQLNQRKKDLVKQYQKEYQEQEPVVRKELDSFRKMAETQLPLPKEPPYPVARTRAKEEALREQQRKLEAEREAARKARRDELSSNNPSVVHCEELRQAMVAEMEYGVEYTAQDLVDVLPCLSYESDISAAKVSYLMRLLVDDGTVIKLTEARPPRFKLAD